MGGEAARVGRRNCIHAYGKYTRIIKQLIKIRPRQDIIKTDLKGIWWNSMDWINVAQDTYVVGTVRKLGVAYMRLPQEMFTLHEGPCIDTSTKVKHPPPTTKERKLH